MGYPTLADNAVDTLARIKMILADVDSGHSDYYALCELKRLAENAISNGLTQAHEIANTAIQLKRETVKRTTTAKNQP